MWENVTEKCMNSDWKHCVKHYMNIFAKFESENELDVIRDKVKLAKDLSLDCDIEDVEELLDKELGELTNEELIEVVEEESPRWRSHNGCSQVRDYQKGSHNSIKPLHILKQWTQTLNDLQGLNR